MYDMYCMLLYIYIYMYNRTKIGGFRASKKTSFPLVVNSTESVLCDIKFIFKLDDFILDFSST